MGSKPSKSSEPTESSTNHTNNFYKFLWGFFICIVLASLSLIFSILYYKDIPLELQISCPNKCNVPPDTQGSQTDSVVNVDYSKDIQNITSRLNSLENKISKITYSDNTFTFDGNVKANDFIIHREKTEEPGIYEDISFNIDGTKILDSLVSKVFPLSNEPEMTENPM